MAQQVFNDGTTGDVVIRPGPPPSGGNAGGGFGGSGGGVSGGFGGSSKKRRKARARAKKAQARAQEQARAQAAAQAQAAAEQVRIQVLQQFRSALAQRHDAIRAEIDRNFARKTEQLAPSLEHEVSAVRRAPTDGSSERWQLYLINKEKNEIDGLIARKIAELSAKNATARSFDGHDPLTRTSDDYLTRLGEFG